MKRSRNSNAGGCAELELTGKRSYTLITISVRESESVDRWDDDLDGLEGFLVDIVEKGKRGKGKKRER